MTCARHDICKECPFRRSSLPGYLGAASYDPQGFLEPHLGKFGADEIPLPCHMAVNWDNKKNMDTAPQCLGFLIFLKNQCQMPRNPEIRAALVTVKQDPENIFQWPDEFIKHHSWRIEP